MAIMIDADKLIEELACKNCVYFTVKGCGIPEMYEQICLSHRQSVKQLINIMAKEAEND